MPFLDLADREPENPIWYDHRKELELQEAAQWVVCKRRLKETAFDATILLAIVILIYGISC